jgi:hypothetical protein
MKKHIQIRWSYDVWKPSDMKFWITHKGGKCTHFWALVIEWWLHNIGYYLTYPFTANPKIKALNERFKHVDLMVESEDANET